jgi:hypothetical protein
MPRISATERRRLGRLRPELWELLLELNDRANAELGFTLAIPEDGGTRSQARQAALYQDALEQGGGTDTAYAVGKPGRSRHNYGAAIDEHIVAGGSEEDGTGTDADYRQLAELAESIGLTAGYYFAERGVGKKDVFHFQLNESLQESIDRWHAMQTAGMLRGVVTIVLAAIGLHWMAGSGGRA